MANNGFANCFFHNHNHDKNSFSIAETQFKDYCEKHDINLKDLLHEHKIKFKCAKGNTTLQTREKRRHNCRLLPNWAFQHRLHNLR